MLIQQGSRARGLSSIAPIFPPPIIALLRRRDCEAAATARGVPCSQMSRRVSHRQALAVVIRSLSVC
jgi:hypothetical protein